MKKVLLLLVLTFACLFGLVACGEPTPEPAENEGLKNAVSYVKNLYIAQDGKATAADYIRASQVTIENEVYTLTWTVEVTTGNATDVVVGEPAEGKVTITVNSKTSSEVVYKLHVKVTAPNGDHDSLTFNHTVPAFKSSTYAEYKEAEDGTPLVVEGIVSAIFSKAEGASYEGLYLNAEDNSGAYYIYSLAEGQSLEGIEEGMKVRASGEKKTHNGTEELVSASLEVIDTNKTTITPVDLTEAYKAAADLKDAALVGKQALVVTVKGVTIGGQNEAQGYYHFSLAGKESYVRISSSVCPVPKAEQAAFKSAHTSHAGWTANVTGIVSVYDGAFYLTPIDANAFEYVSLPELSDADAVAFEQGNLKVDQSKFADGATVQLPLAGSGYKDVVISWASDAEEVVVAADGKATVTLGNEDVEVTLTATLTRGEATLTKEFTFTILAKPVGVKAALDAALDSKVLVIGVIKSIDNAKYGNLYLTDGTNDIYVYGVYKNGVKHGDWAEADQLKVGDVVVLLGTRNAYNGTQQLKNCDLVSVTRNVALADFASATKGTEVVVSATIKSIDNAKYGNLYLTDGTNDLYVYGVYNLAGAKHGDWAEADKLAAGQVVVLKGTRDEYNGTIQLKNATLLSVAAASTDEPTEEPSDALPTVSTVEFKISEYATTNSWVNGTRYESVTVDTTTTASVAGTAVGDYGLNTGKYYSTNHDWRVYQSENGTLTITSTKTIASVVFTYNVKNSGVLTFNGANLASGATAVVGAKTATFGVGNTGTATNGNVQILTITINYAE